MAEQSLERPFIATKGFMVRPHLPSANFSIKRFQDDDEEIVRDIGKVLQQLPEELTAKFTRIRAHVYQVLVPRFGVKLLVSVAPVWLIPEDKLLPLMVAFDDEVVKPLLKLEKEIHAYLASDDPRLKKIKKYHKMKASEAHPAFKTSEFVLKVRSFQKLAKLEYEPFGIDFEEFQQFLKDRERAGVEKLDARQQELLVQMEKEITEKKKDVTETLIIQLQQQLVKLIKSLTPELAKKNAKYLASELDRITELSKSFGVATFLDKVVETTKSVIEAYQKPEDNTALQLVIEKMKATYKIEADISNPKKVLSEAVTKLSTELSPEAKSVLSEL